MIACFTAKNMETAFRKPTLARAASPLRVADPALARSTRPPQAPRA